MILVASYITAFILNGVVNMIALLILVILAPFINLRYRSFAPVVHFLYAFVAGAGAVWAYTILSQNTSLELAYFMLLAPTIFQLFNDTKRVNRAKQGLSGVKRMLENIDDPKSYDQTIDVKSEQSAEFGRLVGFVVSMALLVGRAPFFG